MNPKRRTKDGWQIHKEWHQYAHYDEAGKGHGKWTRWVLTPCFSCTTNLIQMPLSKLVKSGPEQCDGCEAYNAHLR